MEREYSSVGCLESKNKLMTLSCPCAQGYLKTDNENLQELKALKPEEDKSHKGEKNTSAYLKMHNR